LRNIFLEDVSGKRLFRNALIDICERNSKINTQTKVIKSLLPHKTQFLIFQALFVCIIFKQLTANIFTVRKLAIKTSNAGDTSNQQLPSQRAVCRYLQSKPR